MLRSRGEKWILIRTTQPSAPSLIAITFSDSDHIATYSHPPIGHASEITEFPNRESIPNLADVIWKTPGKTAQTSSLQQNKSNPG